MKLRPFALLLSLAAVAFGVPTTADPPDAGAVETFDLYKLSNFRALGDGAWSADNDFQLVWDPPSAVLALFQSDSVRYVIRDAGGNLVDQKEVPGADVHAIRLDIPPPAGRVKALPGEYTVEAWGQKGPITGPRSSAILRFDDTRPGPARPLGPTGWIRAGTETVLRIEHPRAPLPISGIRGYAVVVDHGSGSGPCAGPDRCTEAETDLRTGIAGDSIALGVLPEGINRVRVVAVSGSGMRSQTVETVDLRVDGTEPSVTLAGVPDGWSNGPVQLTATATDPQSGMKASGPSGPFTAIAVGSDVPTIAAGDRVTTTVRGDGIHRIRFYGRDAVGNTGGDEAAAGPAASAAVRIDETPPEVSFATGQDRSEPERIEATVTDRLSGPDLDHGSIAVRPVSSTTAFAPLPTRVSAGRLTARWDSDAYQPGSYEFRATGYDAAGNVGVTGRRLDGTRMVLSNPLKGTTAIQFGFGGRRMVLHRCKRSRDGVHCRREVIASFERRPAARSTPYGRGTPVAGRLMSIAGSPLGGQPVTLIESFAAGATVPQRATTVQTGADGAFLVHLPPGPSRTIQVTFGGTKLLARTGSRTVQLNVATAVHLRTSTASAAIGGTPVLFSGQIAGDGAKIPSEGRPIELQFRVGDTPWSEFRTVQTDSRGRFRYPYAFSDDDSRGVRFQFRAYAPPQPGWPYAPGFSRPVAVTGR